MIQVCIRECYWRSRLWKPGERMETTAEEPECEHFVLEGEAPNFKPPEFMAMTKEDLVEWAAGYAGTNGRPFSLDVRERKEVLVVQCVGIHRTWIEGKTTKITPKEKK